MIESTACLCRSERPNRSSISLTRHLSGDSAHHIKWEDEPQDHPANNESSATATASAGVQVADPAVVEAAINSAGAQTQDTESEMRLAEAQSYIETLQRQLAGLTQQHDSELDAELATAQTRIAALQGELADAKTANHAVHAEQLAGSRASRDATTRLRDE